MKRIWDLLRSTALKDKKITHEEINILDQIVSDLWKYQEILQQAVQDNIISLNEKTELLILREKLWKNASERSLDNGVLTSDEQDILQTLLMIMDELDEIEDSYI